MKTKPVVKRWSRKAIRVGHSLCATIPHDLATQWQIVPGQELVMYEIGGALLLLPLTDILKNGEPKLVKPLVKAVA